MRRGKWLLSLTTSEGMQGGREGCESWIFHLQEGMFCWSLNFNQACALGAVPQPQDQPVVATVSLRGAQ